MLFNFSRLTALMMMALMAPCKGNSKARWSGRLTLGGYLSTERFKDATATGSDKNDFQTISTRLFIVGNDLTSQDGTFVADLRDKHDFFDKLEAEKLSLSERNEFQLRQLSFESTNPARFFGYKVGRFPVYEVGATHVDGLQLRTQWTKALYSTFFGGLNPQKREKSSLSFDPKANVYGLSLTFQDLSRSWKENLYLSHGLVNEIYDGHTDRNFIFQNLIFQWGLDSRLITLIYYDLVPRSYVQNGNLTWQQGWSRYLISDLTYTTIDVIAYSRNKDLLDRLPSSPYNETRLRMTYRIQNLNNRVYIEAQDGQRDIDKLKKESIEVGYISSRIWGPHWDGYLVLGSRDNFTSKEQLIRLGLGRFSRKWELNLDLESQQRKYDDGTKSNPFLSEVALSYYVSRKSYWSLSAQTASDENVSIVSGFFKYGYRFGNREVPPLRDGAPPRGPL